MIEKVGVYCRLSDEDRFKLNKNDDSDSIVNQKSMCIKYAQEHGWSVIDVYSDDNFSGAGTYRPEFERLIKDCENGIINLVLCKTQSRFSRDMEIIEKYLHHKFLEWGVRFVSIVDNADTNIRSNKKSRQINGLINEWYLDDLSQNIKHSLKNRRDDGLFMGSFSPYGYKRDEEDKHKLVIDPIAAKVVKDIFEMYTQGLGYYRISEKLNKDGVLTPSQYKRQQGSNFVCCHCDYEKVRWNRDTISVILHNEVYIGTLIQGKTTSLGGKVHKFKKVPKSEWSITENAHEPIISKEVWDKVQKRLNSHEYPTKTGEIHCLSQKVYCLECNKVFVRNVYRVKGEENHRRAYLQCKSSKKYHTCCNNRSIRLDELETIIINEINKLLDSYYNQKELENICQQVMKDNMNKDTLTSLKLEKQQLSQKLIKDQLYYRKLYEDKVNNVLTESSFMFLSNDYIKEIESINNRLKAIDDEIDKEQKNNASKLKISAILEKYKHIDKLNKIIVDEFIDKIYIGKLDLSTHQREIKIIWNFTV